jgi:hypothetical protein
MFGHSTTPCLLQGWALPLADMKGSDVPVGVWKAFTIPATQLSTGLAGTPASDTNHLRITPTWQTKGLKNVVYVSYRTQTNGDWKLSSSWANQVYVHIYNGDQVGWTGTRELTCSSWVLYRLSVRGKALYCPVKGMCV